IDPRSDLLPEVKAHAATIQARRGEQYQYTSSGQTVLLGSRAGRGGRSNPSINIDRLIDQLVHDFTVYDHRLGEQEARRSSVNIYRIGHYLKAVQDIRAASPQTEEDLRKAVEDAFIVERSRSGELRALPPVKKLLRKLGGGTANPHGNRTYDELVRMP